MLAIFCPSTPSKLNSSAVSPQVVKPLSLLKRGCHEDSQGFGNSQNLGSTACPESFNIKQDTKTHINQATQHLQQIVRSYRSPFSAFFGGRLEGFLKNISSYLAVVLIAILLNKNNYTPEV